MEFKRFSAGMKNYGENNPSHIGEEEQVRVTNSKKKNITNVNFEDEKFWEDWKAQNDPHLEDFVKALAVCHTIIVDKTNAVKVRNDSLESDK